MTTQHTPGNWNFHPTAGGHQFAIYSDADEASRDIGLVYNRGEQSKADAKLMAAAPDLLQAIKTIQGVLQDWDNATGAGTYKNLICHAETAIQRATNS